jgi:predicted kinase
VTTAMIEVLVIAGPAGVGKTTTANEVSAQLRSANVAHAVVDTDALDDVFPVPPNQWELTERNLAFVWDGFKNLGTRRLILAGVYLHQASELAWIRRATSADRLVLVQLAATDETLTARVGAREIGSVRDAQLTRTLRQARELESESSGATTVIETDGRPVVAVAKEIVAVLNWQ